LVSGKFRWKSIPEDRQWLCVSSKNFASSSFINWQSKKKLVRFMYETFYFDVSKRPSFENGWLKLFFFLMEYAYFQWNAVHVKKLIFLSKIVSSQFSKIFLHLQNALDYQNTTLTHYRFTVILLVWWLTLPLLFKVSFHQLQKLSSLIAFCRIS